MWNTSLLKSIAAHLVVKIYCRTMKLDAMTFYTPEIYQNSCIPISLILFQDKLSILQPDQSFKR